MRGQGRYNEKMVDITAPLNSRQMQVLRWIGDGCPAAVMTGHTHKTTAVALQGRRLATVSKRRGVWSAVLTDTGRYYLEHGHFPRAAPASPRRPAANPRPAATTAGTRPHSPTTPRDSKPQNDAQATARTHAPESHPQLGSGTKSTARIGAVDRLIRQLEEAGGRIQVQRPDWKNNRCLGVDYDQLIQAANRAGKVPPGQRTLSKPLRWPHMEIWYAPAIPGTQIDPHAVPVPAKVSRYHPVVSAMRDLRDRHEVSTAHLPRALRILHALVTEAERRDHQVSLVEDRTEPWERHRWAASRDGHVVITVAGHPQPLRLLEIGMPSRSAWNATHHYRQRDTYFTNTGTGRLRLEMAGYGGREGRVFRWSDTARTPLEDKLPAVLSEVEVRGAEDAHREHERHAQEQARRDQREQAARHAAAKALEKQRADTLIDQLHRWETAHRLHGYLTALRQNIDQRQRDADAADLDPRIADAIRWLTWAEEYTLRLDPLSGLPGMPGPA
jgi:hypothetical protein